MEVKFVDFDRQYGPIKEEILASIHKVIDDYSFVNGEATQKFEKSFAEYCGTNYCVGVGSGTDALLLALRACGIGPGDEVIIPDLTYVSTLYAVLFAGATPVISECSYDTFNMDPKDVESKITKSTRAVIFVHFYGNPSGIEEVKKVCDRHKLFLIEDAAQAVGSCTLNSKCGSIGDIGCFSFYPAKNLGCFGQGGAIVTNYNDAAEFIRVAKDIGMKDANTPQMPGLNSRLDDIQAAVLNVNLKYIDEWNARRKVSAGIYNSKLYENNSLTTQEIEGTCHSSYHIFGVNLKYPRNPNELVRFLSEVGIEARIHYPYTMQYVFNGDRLIHDFKLLSLPMHPYITQEEVEYVSDVINNFIISKRGGR